MANVEIHSSPGFLLTQTSVILLYAGFAFFPQHYFSALNFATFPYLASGIALSALLLFGSQAILGVMLGSIVTIQETIKKVRSSLEKNKLFLENFKLP